VRDEIECLDKLNLDLVTNEYGKKGRQEAVRHVILDVLYNASGGFPADGLEEETGVQLPILNI
jgi:hypothetical protein